MKKTLLASYIEKTTANSRNQNPREEGLIATISDIVERESSFENLPKALPKIHEYHKLLIDRSKVKDDDELEMVATMFDLCFSMMIIDRHFARKGA